ncbi:solute symporter family protein [Limnochorda pilosa]|uniref:Sodium:solute symporter n=1 Tax=Limnochorda pilosa TaxID=1555112 RepID=A0A0K2SFW9_LIMPI|nr:cation acetate symporter [Limnochorda pilosa]BAS25932.1 sodium:solute symporter [Limnochorda pilosa]
MPSSAGALALTALLLALTLFISAYARHSTRTSLGFYLAERRVGVLTNAAAICGDYFSSASFLGVAGAVYLSGLDGIWFGAGFGAGFLPVLLLIAAPIRRFGEYSIPDFLGERFQSRSLRGLAVVAVQAIVLLYLVPQTVAVGVTWELLIGVGAGGLSPYQTGVLAVVGLMIVYVALGGMKGTTWNQVIHFALFLGVALFVVAGAFMHGFRYARAVGEISHKPMVEARAFDTAFLLDDPRGRLVLEEARAGMSPEAYGEAEATLAEAARRGRRDTTVWLLVPQQNRLHPEPLRFREPGQRYGAWDQVGVVLSLILGTAGLPHVINRYFTTPTGRMARTSTAWVLILVACFYVLMTLAGVAARQLVPMAASNDPWVGAITVDGFLKNPDQAVLALGRIFGGDPGLALVTAGTFAAILSTVGGLLMASAASWGHDVYEKLLGRSVTDAGKVRVGRAAVLGTGLVAVLLGSAVPATGLLRHYPAIIALMVTWAFSVAGSAFFPTFVAAIWWPRATARGALAGMATGLATSTVFLVLVVLRVLSGHPSPGLWGLTYPTLVSVPAAFGAIVAVSLLDRPPDPAALAHTWLRLHGTARDRLHARLAGSAEESFRL